MKAPLLQAPTLLAPPLARYIGDSRYAATRGNRVSFCGDSISVLWPSVACILSGGRMVLGINASTSGANTFSVLSIQLPVVLADPDGAPSKIVVAIGTNDIATGVGGLQAGITPGMTRANIATIVATIRAAGADPVLCTIPPRSAGALTNGSPVVNAHQKTSTHNAWLKEYCLANKIHLVDIYAMAVDPATNEYRSGWSTDGIHPQYFAIGYFAELVAYNVADTLPDYRLPLAVATDDFTNLLGDGLFLTNPGGLPTGWTLAGGSSNFTGTTVAGVGTLGDWLKLSNTTASPGNGQLDFTVSTGFSVGDRMVWCSRIKADGVSNSSSLSILFTVQLACLDAGSAVLATFAPLTNFHSQIRGNGAFYQEFTVPTGTVSMKLSAILITGSQGYLRLGQMALRDLTAA